jgi:transcriptional regulator with XRE-family HTH domain
LKIVKNDDINVLLVFISTFMTNNVISKLATDEAILKELGERIAQYRIRQELTQAQLAGQSGVSKRTIERIESGHSAQLSSLIRIFRVLELLPQLGELLPAAGSGPVDLLKLKGKQRKRAYSTKQQEDDSQPWTWGDDT